MNSLPNELMLDIACYLPQNTLLELAISNRRFYGLLIPELYRSPILSTVHQLKSLLYFPSAEQKRLVRILDLSEVSRRWIDFSNVDLIHICRNFTNITVLDINHCELITNNGLAEIQLLQSLETIGLSSCMNLTDGGIVNLAKCKNLQHVFLDDLVCVTGDSITELRNSLELQTLDISRTSCSDEVVQNLIGMKSLETLFIVDLYLYYTYESNPKLKIINVYED